MEKKLSFEDYGIEFNENDFNGVSKETLEKCRERIKTTMDKLEKKEKNVNGKK